MSALFDIDDTFAVYMGLNVSVNLCDIRKIRIYIKESNTLCSLKDSIALCTYSISDLAIKIILKISDLLLSI